MRTPQHMDATWIAVICPSSKIQQTTVMTALALGLAQQLTGTEAILYYTPRIRASEACEPARAG